MQKQAVVLRGEAVGAVAVFPVFSFILGAKLRNRLNHATKLHIQLWVIEEVKAYKHAPPIV